MPERGASQEVVIFTEVQFKTWGSVVGDSATLVQGLRGLQEDDSVQGAILETSFIDSTNGHSRARAFSVFSPVSDIMEVIDKLSAVLRQFRRGTKRLEAEVTLHYVHTNPRMILYNYFPDIVQEWRAVNLFERQSQTPNFQQKGAVVRWLPEATTYESSDTTAYWTGRWSESDDRIIPRSHGILIALPVNPFLPWRIKTNLPRPFLIYTSGMSLGIGTTDPDALVPHKKYEVLCLNGIVTRNTRPVLHLGRFLFYGPPTFSFYTIEARQ